MLTIGKDLTKETFLGVNDQESIGCVAEADGFVVETREPMARQLPLALETSNLGHGRVMRGWINTLAIFGRR